MIYRKEIDGLRAVAVIPVVLYHTGSAGFLGGYAGVDVFFVISGFLITTLILEDLRQDRFSIVNFYERRARRILPALTFVVLVTTVLAILILQPSRLLEYGMSMVATAFFGANIYFWRTTDYFATAAEERPLLHMWSLAVEEQFYIVFPLLLLMLWRHQRGRSDAMLFALFLGMSLSSFILAVVFSESKPSANFYLPMTRAWELLVGSIVALVLKNHPPAKTRHGPWLAGFGLFLVVLALLWIDDTTPWPGPLTVVPVAGTALILAFARSDCPTGRLLGFAPIVWIGLLSYSIYLWHQPLFAFARITSPGYPPAYLMMCLALVTVPLAWLSWRFVERPFRKPCSNGNYSRRAIFIASLASIMAIATLGAVPSAAPQFTEKLYVTTLSDQMRERYYMQQEAIDNSKFAEIGSVAGAPCRQLLPVVTPDAEEMFLRCTESGARAVIVTGGSHGIDLFRALAASSEVEVLFGFARGFCRPHQRLAGPAPHACPYTGLAELVATYPDRIALVLYTQAGFTVLEDYRAARSADGLRHDLVEEVGDFLEELAKHVPVLALGPKPMLGINPKSLSLQQPFDAQIAQAQDPGIALVHAAVSQAFADAFGAKGVPYLPHESAIDTQLPEEAIMDNMLTYRDGDHWSMYGVRVFGARLVKALDEMGYGALFPPR